MRYLGIDVHSSASVWCLLDATGKTVRRGRVPTTHPTLFALASELGQEEALLAGHEVGTQVYLVHDAFMAAGVDIEAFNAAHLRMIAASRKKTDKRDAYWIARALQTGMKPHPVYIPRGEVRELRRMIGTREDLLGDFKRWQSRARAQLRSRGERLPGGRTKIVRAVDRLLEHPEGVDTELLRALGLCERAMSLYAEELVDTDRELEARVQDNDVIQRLRTLPGFGKLVSVYFYATIADISRFPNARALSAYIGLVPSIRQTGNVAHLGSISKEGSPTLRRVLVQAAHVVARSTRAEAQPLKGIFDRIYANKKSKKLALVALARHLAKFAFYIWRDGTEFDPARVRCSAD